MLQATLFQADASEPATLHTITLGALRALLLLAFLIEVPAFTLPSEHLPAARMAGGPGCGIAWAP